MHACRGSYGAQTQPHLVGEIDVARRVNEVERVLPPIRGLVLHARLQCTAAGSSVPSRLQRGRSTLGSEEGCTASRHHFGMPVLPSAAQGLALAAWFTWFSLMVMPRSLSRSRASRNWACSISTQAVSNSPLCARKLKCVQASCSFERGSQRHTDAEGLPAYPGPLQCQS